VRLEGAPSSAYDELKQKSGGGLLSYEVWGYQERGKTVVTRYNLAYVNHSVCHVDNGRVLGFENAHDCHQDQGAQRIDLAQLLIKHSQATYFLRASGHSMTGAGIFDNDILVVDRAIKPRNTHIVVAIVDGDFTVKQLYQRAGRVKLKAANPTYPDITPKDGQTIEIWGVVTSAIKQFTDSL
jgi:DNA polymerase V